MAKHVYRRFNKQSPLRGVGGGVSLTVTDKSWSHRFKLVEGMQLSLASKKKNRGNAGRAPGFLLRSCTRLFRRHKGNKLALVIGTKDTVNRMTHVHQRVNR